MDAKKPIAAGMRTLELVRVVKSKQLMGTNWKFSHSSYLIAVVPNTVEFTKRGQKKKTKQCYDRRSTC